MRDEEWVEISERLGRRITELGLTLEQMGPDGAADFELGEEGEIVLFLGFEEHICGDANEAQGTLAEWADEMGADPSRPGAIVEFVERLVEQLEGVGPGGRYHAFFDLDLPPLLERHGLQELDPEMVRDELSPFLTGPQIEAVLIRRDLILQRLEQEIDRLGRSVVLFDLLPPNRGLADW